MILVFLDISMPNLKQVASVSQVVGYGEQKHFKSIG